MGARSHDINNLTSNEKESRRVVAALGAGEAATYIGISPAGIWRLLKSGRLPCVRIGGRTLFRRVDLDALLETSMERVGAARNGN